MLDHLPHAALLLEFLLVAWVFVAHLRERSALRNFVEHASAPDRLKEIALRMSGTYRAPATQFAGDLQRKQHLDELLSQAIVETANTPFGLSPWGIVGVSFAVSAIVFAPVIVSASIAVSATSQARESAKGLEGSHAFLAAQAAIEPAFQNLQLALSWSAVLAAGAVGAGALHWWLNRAEAREARFVQALLEAAIIARPNASAPTSARISELIAPERSLRAPVMAFLLFMVSTGAGWLVLFMTANVKAANSAPVYNVWPVEDRKEPIATPSDTTLPFVTGGGMSIHSDQAIALLIGPDEVRLPGVEQVVAVIQGSRLAADWQQKAGDLSAALRRTGGEPAEVDVVADEDTRASIVLDVLQHLKQRYGTSHVYLVFRRILPLERSAGIPVQARIGLALAPAGDEKPAMSINVESARATFRVDERAPEIDLSKVSWRRTLHKYAAAARGQARPANTQSVAVSVGDREVTYRKLVEVLAQIDNACEGDMDCGVPGLEVRFVLGVP